MENDAPSLGDYASFLRQRLRTILVAGLIGLLLAASLSAFSSRREEWRRRTKVAIRDDSQFLALAISGSIPEARPSIPQLVSEVNSQAFRTNVLMLAELRSASSIRVQATGDEPTGLMTIEVGGPSAAVVNSVLDAAVRELRATRREQLVSGYQSVSVALAARRNLAAQRIAAIDAIIANEAPDSPRTTALIHERVLVQEDLDEAAAGIAAIDRYATEGEGGVRVVGGSEAVVAHGLPLSLVAVTGALLGLMAGTGLVMLRRFLRPTVDSRTALERCGVTCVAVLGRSTGDRIAQAAVGQLRTEGPLAVLRASGVPSTVLERLLPDLESSAVKICDELADAASGSRLLLLVAADTSEDEVRSLVVSARSIAADLVGAVLTGVPDRGLVQALSR